MRAASIDWMHLLTNHRLHVPWYHAAAPAIYGRNALHSTGNDAAGRASPLTVNVAKDINDIRIIENISFRDSGSHGISILSPRGAKCDEVINTDLSGLSGLLILGAYVMNGVCWKSLG
jgi:hypothetical protein